MSTEEVILLVVCLVIALGAIGGGILAFRQSGRRTNLAIGIGAGVAVVGAYLAGIAALLWGAVRAVADWGAGLAAEPGGIPGVIVLLVGVITVVVSIVLGRRSQGRSATSSFQLVSRSKESRGQRRQRERAEAKQRKAESAAAEKEQKAAAKEQRRGQRKGDRQRADDTTAAVAQPASPAHGTPPEVTDRDSRPPATDPAESDPSGQLEDVPERPSDPTASGQLPPMAPGR